MTAGRISTGLAAGGLASAAAMHVAWAAGSPWPLASRAELADAVIGRDDGEVPPAAACMLVAGLLTLAAALLSGGRDRGRLRRLGAGGVVAILATRGGLGLAGRTDLVSPGSSSARFRSLDHRLYSPLCLALAALSLPAVAGCRRIGAPA